MSRKEQLRSAQRDWTVKRLKAAIHDWTAIPVRHQKLSFRGRELLDEIRLTEYKGSEKFIIQVSRLHISEGDDSRGNKWHPIMEPLELGHFGHLLDRAVKGFQRETPLDDKVLEFARTFTTDSSVSGTFSNGGKTTLQG